MLALLAHGPSQSQSSFHAAAAVTSSPLQPCSCRAGSFWRSYRKPLAGLAIDLAALDYVAPFAQASQRSSRRVRLPAGCSNNRCERNAACPAQKVEHLTFLGGALAGAAVASGTAPVAGRAMRRAFLRFIIVVGRLNQEQHHAAPPPTAPSVSRSERGSRPLRLRFTGTPMLGLREKSSGFC